MALAVCAVASSPWNHICGRFFTAGLTFSKINWYQSPVMEMATSHSFSKNYGPMIISEETPHQKVHLTGCNCRWQSTLGLSVAHILQFCLLMNTFNWKWAPSLIITLMLWIKLGLSCIFCRNKLHCQVVARNLSVSILRKDKFCMDTFFLVCKIRSSTLLRGQVVSKVFCLMFLNPHEYFPLPSEYCQGCGQFEVYRNKEGS